MSSFGLLGLSAETNFDHYVTGALVLDAASPNFLLIFPSLSVGGGVVTQWRHDAPTRPGGRFQLGISWPLVSLSFPIDYYPVSNSSRSHFEGAFLTQLSF
jgi:hypothetical protein